MIQTSMKRDYSKIAVLLGLIVLFMVSFRFGFGVHHFHFGPLRELMPFLLIIFIVLMFSRRGRCCGRRYRKGRRRREANDSDLDL